MSVPSSELVPPPHTPQVSVSPPLDPKGGRSNTPLRVRGWEGPNSDDWKVSLAIFDHKNMIFLHMLNVTFWSGTRSGSYWPKMPYPDPHWNHGRFPILNYYKINHSSWSSFIRHNADPFSKFTFIRDGYLNYDMSNLDITNLRQDFQIFPQRCWPLLVWRMASIVLRNLSFRHRSVSQGNH